MQPYRDELDTVVLKVEGQDEILEDEVMGIVWIYKYLGNNTQEEGYE